MVRNVADRAFLPAKGLLEEVGDMMILTGNTIISALRPPYPYGGEFVSQFLVEATTLSLIGGSAGVVLGMAAAHAIANVAGWPTLIQPEAVALVEGFRGDIFAWLRFAADGRIARCHLRDPSWFQWPLLEAAIEGNIVADFPLCNKSFNCSYSGHDL